MVSLFLYAFYAVTLWVHPLLGAISLPKGKSAPKPLPAHTPSLEAGSSRGRIIYTRGHSVVRTSSVSTVHRVASLSHSSEGEVDSYMGEATLYAACKYIVDLP